MKVAIIGVGALGSHLVQLLRNEDADLKVVDFDRVEMKNVASQFHFRNTVGKKKTEALKQAMQFCYGRKLEGVGHKLTADNADQVLGGADLLVDCLDNAEARDLVQRFALANNVACVHGALAADGVFGQVAWTENFTADGAGPSAPTCEDGEFLPFIALTAAYLAQAVQLFLRDGSRCDYMVYPGGAKRLAGAPWRGEYG